MTLNYLALLLFSVVFLLLPLIPAIRELIKPSDTAALDVYQGNYASAKEVVAEKDYQLFDGNVITKDLPQEIKGVICEQKFVVLKDSPSTLKSVVGKNIEVDKPNCTALNISCEQTAELNIDVVFSKIQANPVSTRYAQELEESSIVVTKKEILQESLDTDFNYFGIQNWWKPKKPVIISKILSKKITGAIISKEDIIVDTDTVLMADIKTEKTAIFKKGCLFTGNVVAKHIIVEDDCIFNGNLLAYDSITINKGSRIGSNNLKTTVTADVIKLGSDVEIWGGVFAKKSGNVF